MNEDRSTRDTVLEVSSLRTYLRSPAGAVRAVDGVSFAVPNRTTLGVVGESGSGKTVLGRSIMSLYEPHQLAVRDGGIRLGGTDLMNLSADQLRRVRGRDIAMVFQDPMTSLNPVMTVGAQIVEQLRNHLGSSRRGAGEKAAELLQSVGLPGPRSLMRSYPHQLSGGMRQRVIIAMALSCRPRLLIADEPTTALDVTVQKQILDLLEQQAANSGQAMILVSHDLGVMQSRTHVIAVMYGGRIVEIAPTTTLFTNPMMRYTEALIASIPRLDKPSHERLPSIPGRPPSLVGHFVGCRFAARCAYVREECRIEEPPLLNGDASGTHLYRCWYPVEPPRRGSPAEVVADATAGGSR